MGNYLTTTLSSTEEADIQSSSRAYRYPPKTGGLYFSNHFIMGGEKFDSPQPESFLFGENSDLNFLGSRPAPFPYPPPQASEPTKPLRSLINIRRDSVHMSAVPGQPHVPAPPHVDSETEEDQHQHIIDESQRIWAMHRERKFNIRFTFDSDVRCAITIHYLCTEEISPLAATYTPIANGIKSETFYFKRGVNQVFSQPSHIFQPGIFKDEELLFRYNEENVPVIPVAIQCVALDGDTPRQSHTTVAAIERANDGSFVMKNIKQKLYVDGLSYLLQEIYGLENKSSDLPNKLSQFDEDIDDCGADCVVCMCDLRDTIILPCRHLCLCYACAESLRYQANNCPICRAPFIALLQIRAVQRMSHATHPALAGAEPIVQEGVPPGFTGISLVEALNGPHTQREDPPPPPPVMTLAASESSEVRPSSGKKSRSKRRGSRDGSSSSKTGPRQSSSTSSQLSMTATSPLHEEPEPVFEEPVPKVKGETNVKVSLKIVNEVESKKLSQKTIPIDIVDEELAKMAVVESLDDANAETDAKLHELEEEDLEEEDEDEEDDAGQDGDDEEDEDDANDDAVVITLPTAANSRTKEVKQLALMPGTPMSNMSEISSQDSASSANSVKQLLPSKSVVPAIISGSAGGKTTPVQNEATIVKVVPQEHKDDGDLC
jgi:hypothetical protein